MIVTVLLSSLIAIPPVQTGVDPQDQEVIEVHEEPMSLDIARARLKEAMDHATPIEQRQEMLAEIVARSESIVFRAAAAYNLGVALIRHNPENEQSLVDAIGWLRRADIDGINPALRARARDTLGHARYRLVTLSQSDQPQIGTAIDLESMKDQLIEKVEKLIKSAGAFRSAYEVDPSYLIAIENLERVRREIQILREQINALEELIEQEKQTQQQQQQQQQESAERLDELADQQQQEANENAQNTQQQPEEQKQQQEDQEEICNETQSEQEDLQQSNNEQSEEMQQVQEQLEKAREAQERAEQALEEGDADKASQAQEEAAEALRNAADQLREMSQPQEGEGQGEPQDGEQGEEGKEGNQGKQQEGDPQEGQEDQISEIAKQLLDKERREREARKTYRSTGRPVPVERDW